MAPAAAEAQRGHRDGGGDGGSHSRGNNGGGESRAARIEARNEARSREARVISPDGSPVTVLVVPTNEELEIARQTATLLGARTT